MSFRDRTILESLRGLRTRDYTDFVEFVNDTPEYRKFARELRKAYSCTTKKAFLGESGTRLNALPRKFERHNKSSISPLRSKHSATMAKASDSSLEPTILINGGSGKMGQAVALAALKAGISVCPLAIAGPGVQNHTADLSGFSLSIFGSEHRDEVFQRAIAAHPLLIAVDYTLPSAVNANAEWYCANRLPFVMGTTGGDRDKLLETVRDSGNYAVIAPQMGKQVVAFIAGMEALATSCPGAFADYTLTVTESHQSTKVDTSGTAKEIVGIFQKLGVKFDMSQIEMVRTPEEQISRMKVPEEHLKGHAFHTYRLVSPDGTVSFEFQHNVCGRSIYAEGTVDAALFLAKKIQEKSEKKLFNMIDVLHEGAMR